jgi:hypothetical protein
MKLAQVVDNGPASMGAIGWVAAVLLVVLLCAAIVLAVVLIQYLLVKTRALHGDLKASESRTTDSRTVASSIPSSVVFTPDYRSAAAVPPENPHSGPTQTMNPPRPRTRI